MSDAFRTIRTRKASVSANVHEIGDALKAPVSPKLVVCRTHQQREPLANAICRFFALFGTFLAL